MIKTFTFVTIIIATLIPTIYSLSDGFDSQSIHENRTTPVVSSIVNGVRSYRRTFYVRIWQKLGTFCGGTMIGKSWVLTAGQCVLGHRAEHLEVEIRDFTNQAIGRFRYGVSRIFLHQRYRMIEQGHVNDIALLKLARPVTMPNRDVPLCQDRMPAGRTLAACGMGAVSRTNLAKTAWFLREALLIEAHPILNPCRKDQICPMKYQFDSDICYMDEGGPLFALLCDSPMIECLYGVASYSVSTTPDVFCDGGSFFASVPYFHDWIVYTMSNN